MATQKTWLEVSLNGPWGKAMQPGIPISVGEIVEQAVACAKAGAAIIHVHAYDEATGKPKEDADIYAAIITGIRSQVEVIVYPTVSTTGMAPFSATETPQARFAVQEELAKRGLLEWGAVDPGSTNIAYYDDVREDRVKSFVYLNPEEHLRHALGLAARYRSPDLRHLPSRASSDGRDLALALQQSGADPGVHVFLRLHLPAFRPTTAGWHISVCSTR
jgi:uncharacterized protein (DUF849 family)